MRQDEIGQSYDAIAHLWREPYIQSIGMSQLDRALKFTTAREYALDIGCGCSGRFIDRLITHGLQVEGVDVSERMIALAKERHPNVGFHHADISQWNLPRKYDVIVAWDSIWHVPLEEQTAVMQKICAGLTQRGVCLFTMGGLDEPGEKVDSCMGLPMYYSTLGIPKTLELLTRCGCVCRHLEFDQYPEQHLYILTQKT
jgi:SAM-dependent methyltransferase